MKNQNPPISSLLRVITTIEALVLLGAGGGLFFFYDFMSTQWAWTITPFNSGFLGAIYLASLVTVVLLLAMPYWNTARLLLPMILTFTLVVLIASLLHFDKFNFSHIAAWIWFFLYIIIPLNAIYHLWLYRNNVMTNATPTPSILRAWLILQGTLLGLYGIAMILAPAVNGFWPWKIDDFHSHLYSALALTAVVPAITLRRECTAEQCFTLGMTQMVLGVLAILGVVLRSARVDYSAAGTLFWLAVFGIGTIAGIAIARYGRRLRAGLTAANSGAKLSASL